MKQIHLKIKEKAQAVHTVVWSIHHFYLFSLYTSTLQENSWENYQFSQEEEEEGGRKEKTEPILSKDMPNLQIF